MNPQLFSAFLNGLSTFCGGMISQLTSPYGLQYLEDKFRSASLKRFGNLPQVSSRAHM